MGMLVEGRWTRATFPTDGSGRFVRADSAFRDRVVADPRARFPAAAGRYRLYVAHACPWAHRALIGRALKGLEAAIPVSFVEPLMGEDGWRFGAAGDDRYGLPFLRDLYVKAKPDYTGRVTVPVLWDTVEETIVSNESSEILRMLNDAFGGVGTAGGDLYPAPHRDEIDRLNARIYDTVNNGVYRCGFATSQAAYDEAFDSLFATLDELDARLGRQRWLVGTTPTEADWRLFTTLLRFDPVYYVHFKCNLRRIVDYANLDGYLRDLFQTPGIAATWDEARTKRHYYGSHASINPSGIVPKGPARDLTAPHRRDRLAAAD